MSYHFTQLHRIEGPQIILRPLVETDLEPLAYALVSPNTWFSRTRGLDTVSKFIEYFSEFVDRNSRGESLTLVASHKTSGEFVATSTFSDPGRDFAKIEIGFTWVADRWQRTFVNSELKHLMLTHAFEAMRVNRVEFSVHPDNMASNAAMKRLGAVFEGRLRKWRKARGHDGDTGDRNIYSIIDDEWPKIKKQLEKRFQVPSPVTGIQKN